MPSFTAKLVFACVIVFYALDWPDLLGRLGLMHIQTSFDPIKCAELHNLLLLKALNKTGIESIPLPSPTYADTFLKNFREHVVQYPEYAHLTTYTKSSPLYKFLSLLRAPASEDEFPQNTLYGGIAFTPLAQPLHPDIFFTSPYYTPGYGTKPPVILLYQDVQGDRFINGIFFDVKTNLAKWHYALNDFYPVDGTSDWVPLEQILSHWLQQWEMGKYGFKAIDPGRYDLHLNPWTPHDVSESLRAWESLLAAISSRMSPPLTSSTLQTPISPSLPHSENYNSFIVAFLSRARLPPFKFIAPGITYLINSSFEALYATEPADSSRRKDNTLFGNYSHLPYEEGDDDWRVSLIFPSLSRIPPSYAQKGTRKFKLARLTVERTAGLYSSSNDEVVFFDRKGGMDAFALEGKCPYDGRGRGPKLAEVLGSWRELVEKRIWRVGKEGVIEDEGWWVRNAESRELRLQW